MDKVKLDFKFLGKRYKLLINKNDWVLHNINYKGTAQLFELGLAVILDKIADYLSDGYSIDVGTLFGDTTVNLAHYCTKVVAIEPNPLMKESMDYAIENNTEDKIIYHQIAASDKKGSVLLDIGDRLSKNKTNLALTSIVSEEDLIDGKSNTNNTVSVDTNTIDNIVIQDSLHDTPCKFIKTDTEGHDPFVLLGSMETISKWKPMIFFERITGMHSKKDSTTPSINKNKMIDVLEKLYQLGYKYMISVPKDNCFMMTEDHMEAVGENLSNLLFKLKEKELVTELASYSDREKAIISKFILYDVKLNDVYKYVDKHKITDKDTTRKNKAKTTSETTVLDDATIGDYKSVTGGNDDQPDRLSQLDYLRRPDHLSQPDRLSHSRPDSYLLIILISITVTIILIFIVIVVDVILLHIDESCNASDDDLLRLSSLDCIKLEFDSDDNSDIV